MVHDDDRGDVQIDNGCTVDDDTPIADVVNAKEQLEQFLFDPPAMSQLRRTIRECQSLRKYYSHEYVLVTNEGELECYGELISHKYKGKCLKAREKE